MRSPRDVIYGRRVPVTATCGAHEYAASQLTVRETTHRGVGLRPRPSVRTELRPVLCPTCGRPTRVEA
jgi:hypothetical protein